MYDRHPSCEALARFRAGELSEPECHAIAWHLDRCESCREQAGCTAAGRSLLTELYAEIGPGAGASEESYDDVLSRTYTLLFGKEVELDRDRARAPQLFQELAQHPLARQRMLIANTRRFHSWGLTEHLLQRCVRAWFTEPAAAESLAQLALAVAEVLQPPQHSAQLIHDLRARCWMHLANSRRVSSKLQPAEEAFAAAETALAQGSSDPLERAHLLSFKASLRRDQRRFSEAESMLRRAIGTYRRIGDPHLAGKAMMNLSSTYQARGEPERAIELLVRAVELLDAERDPLLHLGSRHNLIDYLTDAERYMEARAQLILARPLYEQYADPSLRRRWLWVQGKIAAGLAQHDQAETLLTKVRQEYLELELPYDAALVSLELAMVHAAQGRTQEMRRLAREMLSVFQALDIRREALAAVLLFREAAEAERVTRSLLRDIASKLRRSQPPAAATLPGG